MKKVTLLLAVLVIACAASAQCKPGQEKQITDLRDSWVTNWNAGQQDSVVDLYAKDATYLPSDGSRVTGKNDIKAAFLKVMGSKVTVNSVKLDCSGDFAYDSGTYTQDVAGTTISGGATLSGGATISGGGRHVEGNYLVVLKHGSGKWLIVQHASTAKP